MVDSRTKKAKLNIIVSLLSQFVTLVCGLVIPRLMISSFGSDAYGATASIAQFLGYITLLEGGIGGVARAALYKPLANGDLLGTSEIVESLKRFFRAIGYVFLVYVLILACTFKYIGNSSEMDWLFTFGLVVAISISTFAQYFIGSANTALLQAAQKSYIIQIISIVATVLNTILVLVLVKLECNLIVVKLVSGLVFILRPVCMWIYVKKTFKLVKCDVKGKNLLKDKWTGLGQHLAFYLHSHTDIAVLTVMKNLTCVAVYSVYNMVVSQIQAVSSSFATGMEALFGDMLAKKETELLNKTFDRYDTLISIISVVLFSITAVMIVPFIKIYTAGVTDADYIQPIFAVILVASAFTYCLRMPCHSMIIAAGRFKQTQVAAYLEAAINIILSIILVIFFGLTGVAIATLIATLFRFIFYMVYLSKHVLHRKSGYFLKRIFVNVLSVTIIFMVGTFILQFFTMESYVQWALGAFVVALLAGVVTLLINMLFEWRRTISMFKFLLKK